MEELKATLAKADLETEKLKRGFDAEVELLHEKLRWYAESQCLMDADRER